jgi:O-antigen/teichoic acid export membrane protein
LELFRSFAWSAAAQIIARLSSLVYVVLLARILTVDHFGQFSFVQSTILAAQALGTFGFGLTATKYVAQVRKDEPDRAAAIIIICLGGAASLSILVTCVLVIWSLLTDLGQTSALSSRMIIAAIPAVLGMTASNLAYGVLAGLERFRRAAFNNAMSGIALIALVPAGGYFGGLFGAVWAFALANVAVAGISLWTAFLSLKESGISLRRGFAYGFRRELPMFFTFTLPSALLLLIVWPVQWLTAYSITSENPGEMALYAVSMQIGNALLLLCESAGQMLLPRFARTSNDRLQQGIALRNTTAMLGGFTIALAIAVALAAEHVLSIFGPNFTSGKVVLQLTLGAAVLIALETPLTKLLQANDQARPIILIAAVWAGIHLSPMFARLNASPSVAFSSSRLAAYAVNGGLLLLLYFWFTRQSKNRG